jgi:hypothetical protein
VALPDPVAAPPCLLPPPLSRRQTHSLSLG